MPYNFSFLIALLFVLASCAPVADNQLNDEPQQTPIDSAQYKELLRFNTEVNAPGAKGIRGIYQVPEMLSVVVLDSAAAPQVAEHRAADFAIIEQEINDIGAVPDGSPGSIYYSNDPKNFKFECLMLIRNMPKQNPKHSKLVVLEAGPMLICNHPGSYALLNQSYTQIKKYLDSLSLQQSGPMREFYIVSPVQTSDSTKWLTRIMVPVNKK